MTPVDIAIRNALGALAWNAREWHRFRHATGARLAEIAQLSHREVQRIEAGEANPRLDTIVRLAFALKVDHRDLFAPLRR